MIKPHLCAMTVSVCLLFAGCQPSHTDAGGDLAAQTPSRDAGNDAGRDATTPSQRDAAAVSTGGKGARDAGGSKPRDAGQSSQVDAQSPHDAGQAHDAGADGSQPEADSGAHDAGPNEPGPTPRTDGCPEDAPLYTNRVRIWPANGQAAMLVGARVQGSNSGPTTDFVDLVELTQAPSEGQFTTLTFSNTQRYRFLRYYAPPGSQGGLAELEFYYGNRRITGTAFGTAVQDSPYAAALDGDTTTSFAATTSGGGYVGIDIAAGHVTAAGVFSPSGSSSTEPLDVMLTSDSSGAMIRYTIGDVEPTATSGTLYTAPIHLEQGRTRVRAIAYSPCRFDSRVTSASYVIDMNPTSPQGLRSYHLGNSLTDTINAWLKPIADSTGVEHEYARWTIPGAPIKWLAEHQGEGFQDPDGANVFDTFVESYAPIDHLSIQPYSDPDWNDQGAAAVGLLTKALQHSPDIQFWVYAQWPGQTEWATDSFPNGGGNVFPAWQVEHKPTNWEEATENELLYHEAFRDHIEPSVGGKSILIIPGGLALVELKRQMAANAIPDLSGDFFTEFFEDEVHLLPKAQYLVALVFYACLYKQTPEGRVTHEGTGLSEAQAQAFQKIAWDVASNYPGSGI